MSVKKVTQPMNDEELRHWRACYRAALHDCFKVSQKPICAELAAHIADLSISEYRKRIRGQARQ